METELFPSIDIGGLLLQIFRLFFGTPGADDGAFELWSGAWSNFKILSGVISTFFIFGIIYSLYRLREIRLSEADIYYAPAPDAPAPAAESKTDETKATPTTGGAEQH